MNRAEWKFCVIGDPIAHSLSPLMHRWFLDKFGIDGSYDAHQISALKLEEALRRLVGSGIRGINVTTPHKHAIVPFMDQLTPEAQAIGSVNTVKVASGKLIGHNTDAVGFEDSLRLRGYSVAGKRVVLFGTGGAARAVIIALIRSQCREIAVFGRHRDKAEHLVQEFLPRAGDTKLIAFDLSDQRALKRAIGASQLLVNATTVGLGSSHDQSILPDTFELHGDLFVYDLIYRPYRTRLIQQVERYGLSWMNGLEMLILQGIASLRFWIDQPLVMDESSFDEVKKLLRREICQE